MTVFSSGVSMYAMGKLLNLLLGWSFDVSIIVAAVIVLAYILLGGLTSAIYNEVLQFFLIVFGFLPLVAAGTSRGRRMGGPLRPARRGGDRAGTPVRRVHPYLGLHGQTGRESDRASSGSGW